MLLTANKRIRERQKDIQTIELENKTLKEGLSASEAARCDLAKICAEHIRNAKNSALENFKEFSERMLLEREELLSNLSMISDLERDVRNGISKDTLKELHRLREEIFNIRSRESQKDQQIEFLQRQLIDAAERLANDRFSIAPF